jgi:UDP-N-acetylglucosamine--N-acetylmuramyl-(pentapeptide) pyrophosphoryl-undecaprenol N-acetylglucosamine transferase
MASRGQPARLLVFGGSQGARRINELVPAALALLPETIRPRVIHQTGELTRDLAAEAYTSAGVEAEVTTFIDDMARAYGWADLAVCRAGALTVSELAAAGLGAVMIPFPAAVDDHQTRNAEFLVRAGAGLIVQESDLSAASLAAVLEPLLADSQRRREMAEAARSAARPEALETIVSVCLDSSTEGPR